MSLISLNDTSLHVSRAGDGEPLVLVHGSWTDSTCWDAVVPLLAGDFDVVRYDRRGHTHSHVARGATVTRRDHEDDLIALIEHVGGPVHLVGSSFGGSISLAVTARRPELVRSVSVHEPPLLDLGGEGALADIIAGARGLLQSVADEIASGAVESGTRRFVEQVALGPGAWEILPAAVREAYVGNAGTFVQEVADQRAYGFAVDALSDFPGEVQVTRGDAGGLLFEQLVERLADLLPRARRHVIEGAGHAPHLSHPEQLARTIAGHCLAAA